MTTAAAPAETPSVDVSTVMVNASEADRQVLTGLIEAAAVAGGLALQTALDAVTYGPTTIANLLRERESQLAEGEAPDTDIIVLKAVLAAYKSNIAMRLADPGGQLTAKAREAITRDDQLYLQRRRDVWHRANDRDTFKSMSSALLWGVARYANDQSLRRDIRGHMIVDPEPGQA